VRRDLILNLVPNTCLNKEVGCDLIWSLPPQQSDTPITLTP
jgi:hypothetical protein